MMGKLPSHMDPRLWRGFEQQPWDHLVSGDLANIRSKAKKPAVGRSERERGGGGGGGRGQKGLRGYYCRYR